MKKYMIFLAVPLMASCLELKDVVYIGNLYKNDAYVVQNKKYNGYLKKNYGGPIIEELSDEKPLRTPMPLILKTADFYDAETEELLFSYTVEDLKKIRGEIKKRKTIQGAFLLTEKGVIYVNNKGLRRIKDSLKRHNKW